MFLTSLRPESRFPSLTSRPSIGRHRHYDINKGYGTTSRERLQSGVQVPESTGFPKKDARLLQYFKSIFSMILHSLSSLSGSGIFFNFKKRASFLGNPVLYILRVRCFYLTVGKHTQSSSTLVLPVRNEARQSFGSELLQEPLNIKTGS